MNVRQLNMKILQSILQSRQKYLIPFKKKKFRLFMNNEYMGALFKYSVHKQKNLHGKKIYILTASGNLKHG